MKYEGNGSGIGGQQPAKSALGGIIKPAVEAPAKVWSRKEDNRKGLFPEKFMATLEAVCPSEQFRALHAWARSGEVGGVIAILGRQKDLAIQDKNTERLGVLEDLLATARRVNEWITDERTR